MQERLVAYALVLRTLAHATLGRLQAEPWLHVKRVLAEHAEEDARFAVALHGLVPDADPVRPGPRLAEVLRRLEQAPDVAAYESVAYGEVKPALAVAVERDLAGAAERELAALLPLALAQERHLDELPVRDFPEPPPLPVDLLAGGAAWTPAVLAPPPAPRRDPFAEVDELPADALHGALDAAILAAEEQARAAHERPDAPSGSLAQAARAAAEHLRRAAAAPGA